MNSEPRAADTTSIDLDSEARDAALAHDASREAELQRSLDGAKERLALERRRGADGG